MPKDDPVVERVRATRRSIVEGCHGDPRALLKWAKDIEAECAERVRGYERQTPRRPDR